MAGIKQIIKIALALCCIAHSATAATTAAPATTAASVTTEAPVKDLTLTATSFDLETGLDKDFFVQCMYNKTDKSDPTGVTSMKLCHKGTGKTEFEDIASIVINMFGTNPGPASVNEYKDLGGIVSGRLSKDGSEETVIKFEWVYPEDTVVGDFKCIVQTMSPVGDITKLEETITINETIATLPTVIKRVVEVDLGLDELMNDVMKIDARALTSRNKILKKEMMYDGTTYLLATNLWSSTVSAQTICQINGAYLVEINDAREWDAVKTIIAGETGPILAGATNKSDKTYWYYMRQNNPIAYADWSASAVFDDNKRCMMFSKASDAEGWKMNTIECTGMMYESFMCEQPANLKK